MRKRTEVMQLTSPRGDVAKVSRYSIESRALRVLMTVDQARELKGGEIVWIDSDEPEPIIEVAKQYATAIRVLPRTRDAVLPAQSVDEVAALPALTVREAIRELVQSSAVVDKSRLQAAIDEVMQ